MNEILGRLRHGLIVSCQALEDEPLHGADLMATLALAAKRGGAHGIRANSPKDIRSIRRAVDIPIIGIYKYKYPGFAPYITPTFHEAKLVAEAGADIVAIDATSAAHPLETVPKIIERIHHELNLLVMADISTVEEARNAQRWGADLVATTLRGYTPVTRDCHSPDFDFVQELTQAVQCPVIAEGGIKVPVDARRMLTQGAFAVVVGTAITRPQVVTQWFVKEMGNQSTPAEPSVN